jgi:hypothetical protein
VAVLHYGGENWLKRQDTAALRFTKPDNRHGRGALVKERAPLLSLVGESGRKNSKEEKAKYSFRIIEEANLLKHIMKNLNGSILSQK